MTGIQATAANGQIHFAEQINTPNFKEQASIDVDASGFLNSISNAASSTYSFVTGIPGAVVGGVAASANWAYDTTATCFGRTWSFLGDSAVYLGSTAAATATALNNPSFMTVTGIGVTALTTLHVLRDVQNLKEWDKKSVATVVGKTAVGALAIGLLNQQQSAQSALSCNQTSNVVAWASLAALTAMVAVPTALAAGQQTISSVNDEIIEVDVDVTVKEKVL